MNHEELFSAQAEIISLNGLNTILKFTNFHPLNTQSFREGLELSGDLKSDKGTILYPTGTEITWERINRLLKFREANPKMEFSIQIKRSDKLIQRIREEIRERMKHLLDLRRKNAVFRKLLEILNSKLDPLLEKSLEDSNINLALYKIRFTCEFAKSQRAFFIADHAMNVALFSVAIACTHKFESVLETSDEKLCQILKAGLFHNYGGVLDTDKILELPHAERPPSYWEACRKNFNFIQEANPGEEALAAITDLYNYQKGQRDIIAKDKERAISNILVVADSFLQREDGLFSEPNATKDIVDNLNVKATEKQYNNLTVQALTLGLDLSDIFDFYSELEHLIKKCPYDSAVAYPLTGLYSPTIFVCKKRVTKCPFLELSVRAVNLMQRLGDLPTGEYHRCKLLTPKLIKFYDEHYVEIKSSTSDKGKTEPEGNAPAAPAPAAAKKEAEPAKEKSAEK